jgi:nicotinate dehydrogenase subunit A
MATTIKLTVNGKPRELHADDPSMPLLYALRDDLGLHGLHFGCGLAQCGACTVLYFGEALRSCVIPVSAVAGAEVVTLEGLGTP